MPIDDSQAKQLFAWLRGRKVREDCPACGAREWKAGDIVAPPSGPGGGGTVVGGPSHSLVQIICGNCAHVMHFACTDIGLRY